jgi:hypothetical protein
MPRQTVDTQVEKLQAQLQQRKEQAALLAEALEEAEQRIAQLQGGESREERGEPPQLGEAFAGAWALPHSRMLLLTVVSCLGVLADPILPEPLSAVFQLIRLFLFLAWSYALWRRVSLWRMLTRWMVYFSVLFLGGYLLESTGAYTGPYACGLFVVAMAATFSSLSERLAVAIPKKLAQGISTMNGWCSK